jgi:hypothetical protein
MSSIRKLLLAVAGMATSRGLLTTSAFAQTQIGGIVTLKLSDPGGASEPWRVQRQLLRTWPGMRSCEAQKMSFMAFHPRIRRMTRQFDVMLRRIRYTNRQLNLSRAEPSWRT